MTDETQREIDELIAAEKRDALERFRAKAFDPGAAGDHPPTTPRRRRPLLVVAGALACGSAILVLALLMRASTRVDPAPIAQALSRAQVFAPASWPPSGGAETRESELVQTIEAALWRARRRPVNPARLEGIVLAVLERPATGTPSAATDGVVDEASLARRIERLKASGQIERLLARRRPG